MIDRHYNPQQDKSEVAESLKGKPFVFFYKVAFLRKNFIKSYSQNSNIDAQIEFNSDGDVLSYIPRAMQIGAFMPFPNMWFDEKGKSGRLGRIMSGWEMILMMCMMCWCIYKITKTKMSVAMICCIIVIAIYFLGLGLVVTNGGALYRMRLCSWLIIGALCHALSFRSFVQDDSVEFKIANEK
jgi:hypothetical protein